MECEVVVKGGWWQIAVFFLMTSLAALFESKKNRSMAGEPGLENG
jgi:hypothetical protein